MLTYGMVGGGQGSFIGAIHRTAAELDHKARFVAGALSSDPDRAVASAKNLGLADDRCYPTWEAMLEAERSRDDRIDFVSIVTPNHAHFAPAKAFIEAGFHVVIDKPMTVTSAQAEELEALAAQHNVVCAVTYNYTGYPLVRQARELVRSGELGEVRKVVVEYHQGWLATELEATGMKQAEWRTDPAKAGAGGAIGDIGTHAENLISFVTGLELHSLCADLTTFVPGRRIDDDASVLLRFASGAKGTLSASQVCVGEKNNLTLRVFGQTGSLAWAQEEPNKLVFVTDDGIRILTRGDDSLCDAAKDASRLPPGHPEAFFEAFANIYAGVIEAIGVKRGDVEATSLSQLMPTAHEGTRGVRFVEKVVGSSNEGAVWVEA